MAEVREIKIDGYKVFYGYLGGGIYVYVNKQSQFQKGQKDAYNDGPPLTEQQATEARSLKAREVEWPAEVKYARRRLQVNNFDLEKE